MNKINYIIKKKNLITNTEDRKKRFSAYHIMARCLLITYILTTIHRKKAFLHFSSSFRHSTTFSMLGSIKNVKNKKTKFQYSWLTIFFTFQSIQCSYWLHKVLGTEEERDTSFNRKCELRKIKDLSWEFIIFFILLLLWSFFISYIQKQKCADIC